MPVITTPMIAVFVFQFFGCEYQPPAGDQTCLGYLYRMINWCRTEVARMRLCVRNLSSCALRDCGTFLEVALQSIRGLMRVICHRDASEAVGNDLNWL